MSNLIIAHTDADGILAARIIYLLLDKNADIHFIEWGNFGITSDAEQVIREKTPKTLFILDLGTNKTDVERVLKLKDEVSIDEVYWIDHHPPEVEPREYQRVDFKIINNPETCTAGLVYKFAQAFYGNDLNEWIERWTIIGIYGDKAEQGRLSQEILANLSNKHPYLLATRLFEKSKYVQAQLYAVYFNAPRRVAYHYGAYLSFKACEEIESFGSLTLLDSDDLLLLAQYPSVLALKYLVNEYRRVRDEVLKNVQRILDLGYILLVQISSKFDLGGIVASYIANKYRKPCIVVNYGVPLPIAKVNCRGVEGLANNIDLGQLMKILGIGGGHPLASAGAIPKNKTLEEFAREVIEALRQYFEEKRE